MPARRAVLDAVSVLQRMAAVSSERGGQSGGLVTYVAERGGEEGSMVGVRVRVLPAKRQALDRLVSEGHTDTGIQGHRDTGTGW